MREEKYKKYFFITCKFLAIAIGFYHANKFFFADNDNARRHLLFVGISVITAFGFWKRPKWFVYFFALLLLLQLYNHGTNFYYQWKNASLFAGKSFAIIILMPIAFIALVNDTKKNASKKS